LGKIIAKKLNYKFIDSDALIEEKTGVKVPLIFEYEGEAGFRKRETKILSEIIKMNSIVLATGGGIILSKTNRQLLSKYSVVIYLNATIKELVKRLANDKDRPSNTKC
jgi:shikimate kinase